MGCVNSVADSPLIPKHEDNHFELQTFEKEQNSLKSTLKLSTNALHDSVEACNNLGCYCVSDQSGLPSRWAAFSFVAFEAFHSASLRGYQYASFNLSVCLRFGIGCRQNVNKADSILFTLQQNRFLPVIDPHMSKLLITQQSKFQYCFVRFHKPHIQVLKCTLLQDSVVDVASESFTEAMCLMAEVLRPLEFRLLCTRSSEAPDRITLTAVIGGHQFGLPLPFASNTLVSGKAWALTATIKVPRKPPSDNSTCDHKQNSKTSSREYSRAQFGGCLTCPELNVDMTDADWAVHSISIRLNLDGNFASAYAEWNLNNFRLSDLAFDRPIVL